MNEDNKKRNQEVIDFYNTCFGKKVTLKTWEPYIEKAFARGHDMNAIKKAIYGCIHHKPLADKYKKIEYILRNTNKKTRKKGEEDNVVYYGNKCNLDFSEETKEVDYKKKPLFWRKEIDDCEKMSFDEFVELVKKESWLSFNVGHFEKYKEKFLETANHFDRDLIEKAVQVVAYESTNQINDVWVKNLLNDLPLHVSRWDRFIKSRNMFDEYMFVKYNKQPVAKYRI